MGFWHTGYLDHIETGLEGVVISKDPKPYFCKSCHAAFSSQDELTRHRFELHTYTRPVLLLRGDELPSTRKFITRTLIPSDISFENCERISLEGQTIPAKDLGDHLSGIKTGIKSIVLHGSGSDVEYELEFAIPLTEHIEEVDRRFYELTSGGVLDLRVVNSFIESISVDTSARRYLDGITQYLYGILAKDQKGDTKLPQTDYKGKYNQALDLLRDYDGSTARIICGIVNFDANVFSLDAHMIDAPKLQSSIRYFQKILLGVESQSENLIGLSFPNELKGKKIPLDSYTDRIIEYSLMQDSSLDKHIKEIQATAQKSNFVAEDRFKLRVIAVDFANRHQDYENLKSLLRPVVNDAIYGDWAKKLQENLSQ